MCFPFCPGKRQHINKFDPHPFPGQSREVVYVYWLFSPLNGGNGGFLIGFRGPKLNTNFFFSNFSGTPGISRQKSRDIPPKSLVFHGFRRTYRTFWPPPLHVEDPHPTRKFPDQKVWVWLLFSSLIVLKFRRVTIRGAQPSARISEEICLSEGSQGPLRGSL